MSLPPFPIAPGAKAREGRVLIVDDNADLADNLQAVLAGVSVASSSGHAVPVEVVTASRGAEAVALAQKDGFDVAIVDVKLPDGSGVDLIGPLRAASPFSEVVLITGVATVDVAMGALRSGAFAFVTKSFRPAELISTIEQALTKVRLKRERDELERRYRALVDLTDVIVVALDRDDRVALFNRKATSLTGVPAEAALGRRFADCWVSADDRHKLRDALAAVRAGEKPRDTEVTLVDGLGVRPATAEGRSPLPRRVRWHLSMARAGEGASFDLVYGIGIDVTERRILERRAADAEALSAMGELALNLAHEIRNPLNAAVLQLHMLGRDVDKLDVDAEMREKLHKRGRIVEREVGRLNRLLTEFLELARPRNIAREPVHMGALVDAVLDLEHDAAVARGIEVVRNVPPDGCVALGDSEKLKQVVLNLVVNAVEAMREGGTLTVQVDSDSDTVRVTVSDTGPGIPSAILDQVFDPFFTTKEAGTGLGLSIVRKIIDQHGGDIHLDTAPGAGTRVHVVIPTGRTHNG